MQLPFVDRVCQFSRVARYSQFVFPSSPALILHRQAEKKLLTGKEVTPAVENHKGVLAKAIARESCQSKLLKGEKVVLNGWKNKQGNVGALQYRRMFGIMSKI